MVTWRVRLAPVLDRQAQEEGEKGGPDRREPEPIEQFVKVAV